MDLPKYKTYKETPLLFAGASDVFRNQWWRGGDWIFADLSTDEGRDAAVKPSKVIRDFIAELKEVRRIGELSIEDFKAECGLDTEEKISIILEEAGLLINENMPGIDLIDSELKTATQALRIGLREFEYEDTKRKISLALVIKANAGFDFKSVDQGKPLETYHPLSDEPTAYLEFAHIVDDIWDPNVEDRRSIRTEKFLAFCRGYGPPYGNWAPDLDVVEVGIQWAKSLNMSDAIRSEHGVNAALAHMIGKNILPYTIRFNRSMATCDAILLAIALRCYQSLYVDWNKFQPALKSYLSSEGANTIFSSGHWVTPPSPLTCFGGPTGDAIKCLDNREDVKKYLALLMTTRTPNESKRGFVQVDHMTGELVRGDACTSLMAMLWTQFEEVVLTKTQVKRCVNANCLKPFEVNTRADQKYCSTECRSQVSSKKHYDNVLAPNRRKLKNK